jgi:hypothetical protein
MLRVAGHRFAGAGKHLPAAAIESELHPVAQQRRLASAPAKSGCGRGEKEIEEA